MRGARRARRGVPLPGLSRRAHISSSETTAHDSMPPQVRFRSGQSLPASLLRCGAAADARRPGNARGRRGTAACATNEATGKRRKMARTACGPPTGRTTTRTPFPAAGLCVQPVPGLRAALPLSSGRRFQGAGGRRRQARHRTGRVKTAASCGRTAITQQAAGGTAACARGRMFQRLEVAVHVRRSCHWLRVTEEEGICSPPAGGQFHVVRVFAMSCARCGAIRPCPSCPS